MKSLKFEGIWNIQNANSNPKTIIEQDDVIVDIAVCGICGTDVGIITGSYNVAVPGTIIGHEAAGIVSKIGDKVTKFKVGDRVVINPTYSCGKCRMCTNGNPNHCEQKMGTEAGVSYDGAFAENYRAKEDYLIKLDDNVTFSEASLTEPLSCVTTGIDKLNITHTNIRSGVIGAGPMGMLYLWSLYINGVKAFLVENNEYRYNFAKNALPPNTNIYKDFNDAIKQEYGSAEDKIDLCVDTTGVLVKDIFTKLAPGGKILNVALKNTSATLDLLKIADKSLSIIGSIDSLNNSFERSYEIIRNHKIPVAKLVSHVFEFNDYKQAFKTIGCDLEQKKLLPPLEENCKVLIQVNNLK